MPLPIFPDFPPLADSEQGDSQIRMYLGWFGGGAHQESEAGLNYEVTIGKWSWHRSRTDINTIDDSVLNRLRRCRGPGSAAILGVAELGEPGDSTLCRSAQCGKNHLPAKYE